MKSQQKTFLIIIAILAIIIIIFSITDIKKRYTDKAGKEAAIINYKQQVDKYSAQNNLPASYIMALIMLESSGRKNIKPRFEEHIYQQLLQLKKGEIKKFEDLSSNDLKNLSKKEIKNLSKSYGPFQIMGYKSIKMNIKPTDLEGKNAIKIGIEWINNEYGNILRQGKFKDAFHLHNTGKKYPKSGKAQTHNPRYVDNGLAYIRYFSTL